MDPALSAALVAFAVCFALAAVAPPPPRAPPGERAAYLTLLTAGAVTFIAAATMPLLGLWTEGVVGCVAAISLVLLCMWLARSPLRRDAREDDEEEGGGGGRRPPEPPEPVRPPGDVAPQGPTLDWGSFDDARAGWETPSPDRELVGV